MANLVDIKQLKAYLPTKEPLFSINQLSLKGNASILIKGPSGKGKTTFLHMLAGLFRNYQGGLKVLNENLNKMTDSELTKFRRKNISIIFQKFNLIDYLMIEENMVLGLEQMDKTRHEEMIEIIKKLGLEGKRGLSASKLSVGEQQRLAVGRALLAKPKLLLADEPTSSLDKSNTDIVMNHLLSIKKHTTLIVVSHDDRIENLFDQVINFEELCE